MSGTSFVKRRIDVTFTKKTGTFAASGTNTVTLSGLRVTANISNVGGAELGGLDLRVFGMTQTMMNELSWVIGAPYAVGPGNTVTVQAGIDGQALATVYTGTIYDARADYRNAPNVPFCVLGMRSYFAALQSVPPTSYQGPADVAVIMANLARLMGRRFENNGVSVKLSNPYFSGSLWSQVEACRDAAGINVYDDGNTLAIWPRNGARNGAIPLISPSTGLVGYPIRTPFSVDFDMLYRPDVTFGAKVQLETSVVQAAGTWGVTQLNHYLEAETPGGHWMSHVVARDPAYMPG